jgi:hypothetical protein
MMPNTSPLPLPQTEPDRAFGTLKPWHTELTAWLPIIIGLTVLYVPSLYDLFTGIWSSDEQMHGFADMVLFLSAMMLIIGFDTALQKFESFRHIPS